MRKLSYLKFKNHPILKNLKLNFHDNKGNIYNNIVLVGENGCGKTTILKEIQNYYNSSYIIDKEQDIICEFLQHDIKYNEIINVVSHGVTGSLNSVYGDGAPSLEEQLSEILDNSFNKESLEDKICVNRNILDINSKFTIGTKRIFDFIKSGKSLKDFLLHALSKTSINNSSNKYIESYIDNYCSGEQEILLRILYLGSFITEDTNVVLIDEPETALHPKWQLSILELFRTFVDNYTKFTSQFIIATHSENILKSVLEQKNNLIIRLYSDNNEIKASYINEMDRALPNISFAEIQFLIFDIATNDYHNQLFGYLQENLQLRTIKDVDNYILTNQYYNINYNKTYTYNVTTYNTLPSYIRNAIHHPEDNNLSFTIQELKESILLLRKIIKSIV